jgi:outer membrane protein assembly factor BamB
MRGLAAGLAIGLVVVGGVGGAGGVVEAQDWPQWRGPDGRRISSERDLPTMWGPDTGVAWRTPLRGLGVSSPIVSGDLVFLTSQLGRGPLRPGGHPTLVRGGAESPDDERPLGGARVDGDGDGVRFLVSAFDRQDGHLVWEYELAAEGDQPQAHQKHNMASPSAVSDGDRVYAWFATGQLVALDLAGELVWQRHLGRDHGSYEIVWGHSSSPVLYRDLIILQSDHENGAYILALDRHSGQPRWKADRGPALRSFSTPLVVAGPDGDELVVNANAGLDGYDPSTGEWLWHADGHNEYPIAAATFDEAGMVYTARGHRAGPYLAIRLGGRGVVDESHVAWRVPTGAPYVSSILYYEGLIYMANGNGIVTAVDAATGERVWQDRLGGIYSASPVAGDGKVYLFSETGETVVLRAGREPHVLQRNDLGERVVSSPAVSGGRFFIRTDDALLAVGR